MGKEGSKVETVKVCEEGGTLRTFLISTGVFWGSGVGCGL